MDVPFCLFGQMYVWKSMFFGAIFWGRKARMEVVDHRITASETIATPPRGRPRCLTRRCVRGACTCTTAASSTPVQQQSGQFTCLRNVDLSPVWQPATVLASRLPVTGPAVVADFFSLSEKKTEQHKTQKQQKTKQSVYLHSDLKKIEKSEFGWGVSLLLLF